MAKKIPERTCLACRTKKAKRELVRIVRSPEGDVAVDATGKAAGRGTYLCPSTDCLKKLKHSSRLENALKTTIDQETFDRLLEEVQVYAKDQ